MNRHSNIGQQRGVALVIVIMVVALVIVLITEMAGRLQLQVQRASNIKESNQAFWYAMGAEQFAQKSIKELIKANADVINLEQPWSQEFTYPIEGGGIQAQLSDLQSCFNLNALRQKTSSNNEQSRSGSTNNNNGNSNNTNAGATFSNPDRNTGTDNPVSIFLTMLKNAEFEIEDYSAEVLADSLADWLDEDSDIRDNGAEDSDYESLIHPYLAANNLMASKSEIRLVNGVDLKWLKDLMPLICVIPGSEELKINVNTIDAEHAAVLAAITGLSVEDARGEITSRSEKGWDSIQDFVAEPAIQAVNFPETKHKWLDVKTEHFILRIKTRYNNATFSMSSVFKVSEGEVSVIRREFGGVS